MGNFLNSSVSNTSSLPRKVLSFRNIYNKQKLFIFANSHCFIFNRTKSLSAPASDSKTFILNLSKHILTDPEEAALVKDLNFSDTYPHSRLDMIMFCEIGFFRSFHLVWPYKYSTYTATKRELKPVTSPSKKKNSMVRERIYRPSDRRLSAK
jgi:hypothetical protein